MKHTIKKRSTIAGGFFGTALLIGLIGTPTVASAYVDENLIDHVDGLWFVTPAGDSERDADTVQHVADSANEGDTIVLRQGIFHFGVTGSDGMGEAKSVSVARHKLTIEGETKTNALGHVENYLTVINASADPFITQSPGVVIEGIRVERPEGTGFVYEPSRNKGEMINMSVRVALQEACRAIPGFVIAEGRQTVLIRAVGPALAEFGVAGEMEDPELKVFSGDQEIASNDDWCDNTKNGEACLMAAKIAGAFPLQPGSKDASIALTLDKGVYSVVVCGKGGSAGEVLLEVYGVPAPEYKGPTARAPEPPGSGGLPGQPKGTNESEDEELEDEQLETQDPNPYIDSNDYPELPPREDLIEEPIDDPGENITDG